MSEEEKKPKTTEIMLRDVRISFPDLFVAKSFEGQADKEPKYGAAFVVTKGSEADKKIQARIEEVGTEAFGKRWPIVKESIKLNKQKFAYLPGELKDYDGYAGNMILSAKRNQSAGAPLILDSNPNVLLKAGDGRPYSGCYVVAKVSIYASTKWEGVWATLIAVQFLRHGDAFTASGPANADGFKEETSADELE